MKVETMQAFARAWASRDVDAVLAVFTEDGVYRASVGPEPGCTYTGHTELRAGIAAMFAHDDGSTSEVHNLRLHGDHGFWEWTYTFRLENGETHAELGCDFFEFEGEKIRLKNAFRKVLG